MNVDVAWCRYSLDFELSYFASMSWFQDDPYGSFWYCGWASKILHQLYNRWFIHVYPTMYRVSTILLVVQDFAGPSTVLFSWFLVIQTCGFLSRTIRPPIPGCCHPSCPGPGWTYIFLRGFYLTEQSSTSIYSSTGKIRVDYHREPGSLTFRSSARTARMEKMLAIPWFCDTLRLFNIAMV